MKNIFVVKFSPKTPKLRKRRGLADIIGTMMLMAVTVTGAATLTYFVNDAFITGNLASASTLNSSTKSLSLLSYDARDSSSLLNISNLDNQLNGKLCGVTCSGTNQLPVNGGSEFIILKIKNNSFESVFLDNIQLNNVEHKWDMRTSGILLDTSIPDLNDSDGRSYPADGKFSIIHVMNSTQFLSNEIPSGSSVNLLIKLGSSDSDIPLSNGIRGFLHIGTLTPTEFLIESGDVR